MAASEKIAAPVMTAAEVRALLRIGRGTLYRLVKQQQLPFFRVGTEIRFSREAIDKWRLRQEQNRRG